MRVEVAKDIIETFNRDLNELDAKRRKGRITWSVYVARKREIVEKMNARVAAAEKEDSVGRNIH